MARKRTGGLRAGEHRAPSRDSRTLRVRRAQRGPPRRRRRAAPGRGRDRSRSLQASAPADAGPRLRGRAPRHARTRPRPLRRRRRARDPPPGRGSHRARSGRSDPVRGDRGRVRHRPVLHPPRAADRDPPAERVPGAEHARRGRADRLRARGDVLRDHALPRHLRALADRVRAFPEYRPGRPPRLHRGRGAVGGHRRAGALRLLPRPRPSRVRPTRKRPLQGPERARAVPHPTNPDAARGDGLSAPAPRTPSHEARRGSRS